MSLDFGWSDWWSKQSTVSYNHLNKAGWKRKREHFYYLQFSSKSNISLIPSLIEVKF